MNTDTRTLLEVSERTYREIHDTLQAADRLHPSEVTHMGQPLLHMQGIVVALTSVVDAEFHPRKRTQAGGLTTMERRHVRWAIARGLCTKEAAAEALQITTSDVELLTAELAPTRHRFDTPRKI